MAWFMIEKGVGKSEGTTMSLHFNLPRTKKYLNHKISGFTF